MPEKCVFNLNLSLAIIQKGFNKSFNEGCVAVKNEAVNLYTNVKERFAPKRARFDQVAIYEYKDGKMYWQGDSMPVADHLRRFTLMLGFQGASPDWIAQAKKDQQVFDVVQDKAKNLKPGQAIQYLSQKDPDPNKGVSLQQIVNDDGVLKHQSHLLPFDNVNQINQFITLASDGRGDLSLDDDISGWIVTGDRIDFDKNLPEMIIGSMLSEQVSTWPQLTSIPNLDLSLGMDVSDRVVSVEPSSFWWQLLAEKTTEFQLKTLTQETTIDRTIVTSGSEPEVSEVFKVTPTRIIPVDPEQKVTQYQSDTIKPTGSYLVGQLELLLVNKVDPVIRRVVFKSGTVTQPYGDTVNIRPERSKKKPVAERVIMPTTSGSDPVGQQIQERDESRPTRTVPVGWELEPKNQEGKGVAQQHSDTVKMRTEQPKQQRVAERVVVFNEVPTRRVLEGLSVGLKTVESVIQKKKTPVYIVPRRHPSSRGASSNTIKTLAVLIKQTESKQEEQAGQSVTTRIIPVGQRQEIRRVTLAEPPLLQVKLEPVNDKEIPFWQPVFDDFASNDALVLVVVTTFFLIVNTVWVRTDNVFLNHRGSDLTNF